MTSIDTKQTHKTLFKNASIYVVLQVVNKGIPFLLLPILTRYFSTQEYGIIASYNLFLGFITILIAINLHGAANVNYFHLKKDEFRNYVGNLFNILLFSTLIVLIIVFLFSNLITGKLNISSLWLYVAICAALMQTLTIINLTLWMAEQKPKPYAIYEISQTLVNIGLSLLLVIVYHFNWQGRIIGTSIASIIFGLISMYILFKRGFARFNYYWPHIKDALKFGIPLIPHQFALWMRSGIDIVLITSIVGLSATGVYSVGLQLGAIIGIIAHAFNNAYSPYLYKKLKNITNRDKLSVVIFTYLYFISILLIALCFSAIFIIALPLLVGKDFQEASRLILLISLAYAFNGMYLMVVNYIYYVKKTHLLSMATIATSILHVLLSYLLLKEFGIIGVAYASLISFFISFVIVWRISAKVYTMPWNLKLSESNQSERDA